MGDTLSHKRSSGAEECPRDGGTNYLGRIVRVEHLRWQGGTLFLISRALGLKSVPEIGRQNVIVR